MMEYHWNGHSYDVTSYPNTLPKRKISVGDVLTIICISAFGLFLGGILCWGLHLDATYALAGEVCYIDNKTNEVYVVDEYREVYSYIDEEDAKVFNVGDFVSVKFDHMGTESNRKDDRILRVRPRSRKRRVTTCSQPATMKLSKY